MIAEVGEVGAGGADESVVGPAADHCAAYVSYCVRNVEGTFAAAHQAPLEQH